MTVYCLKSRERLCKFSTFGVSQAVCLARVLKHRLILHGQGGKELLVRNDLKIEAVRSVIAEAGDVRPMATKLHGRTPGQHKGAGRPHTFERLSPYLSSESLQVCPDSQEGVHLRAQVYRVLRVLTLGVLISLQGLERWMLLLKHIIAKTRS